MPDTNEPTAAHQLREWINTASLAEILYFDAVLTELRARGIEERAYAKHNAHIDPLGRPKGAAGTDAYWNWRTAVDARIRAQHARALLEAQLPC